MSKCGDLVNGKYMLLKLLGCGTFAHVWMCYNVMNNKYYAIKILESEYHDVGMDEISLLKKIKTVNCPYLTTITDSFTMTINDDRNVCLISKLMSGSLYDIMKRTRYVNGFPINFVGRITYQILVGLDHLHNKLKLMHTDVKPENILLDGSYGKIKKIMDTIQELRLKQNTIRTTNKKIPRNKGGIKINAQKTIEILKDIVLKLNIENTNNLDESEEEPDEYSTSSDIESDHDLKINRNIILTDSEVDSSDEDEEAEVYTIDDNYINNPYVKLADFGNCVPISKKKQTDIQTRYYRSPEIILRGEYNETNDIWALGCTIYELLTGQILFNPQKQMGFNRDRNHLLEIQKLFGPIPENITDKCRKKIVFYKKNGLIKGIHEFHKKSLKTILITKILNTTYERELDELCDFLHNIFEYDIKKRYDTKKCLMHPWIRHYAIAADNQT